MVIPPDRLPGFMIVLGRLSPATYAASALRQTFLGPVTGQITIDLAVLLVAGLIVFGLVVKRLDWRVS